MAKHHVTRLYDVIVKLQPYTGLGDSGRFRGWAGQAGLAEVGKGYATQQHASINTSGPGRVESDLSMKTKTHFAFRVDIWDDAGTALSSTSQG